MSGKPKERKHPEEKCSCISSIVHQFTELPISIITIVGENEAIEYGLPQENGYFKLPNEDFYPYNLFQVIQQITTQAGDVMEFKVSKKVTKLLPFESQPVTDAMDAINAIMFNVTSTEVTESLNKSWKSMDSSVRNNNPGILQCIQTVFTKKGIKKLAELPKTENDIIMLMKEIPTNSIVPQLFQQALGIKVPKLGISLAVGQCYNIINDCTTPVSIFKFADSYTLSPIGYLIPSEIKCDMHSETKDVCQFVNSYNDYINCRLKDLNVIGQIRSEASAFNIDAGGSTGYNVITKNAAHDVRTKFTSLREYRQFRLTLANDIALDSDFESVVRDLPRFDLNDHTFVTKFQAFFQRYGTHVVISCFGGGSIEIEATVQTSGNLRSVDDLQKFTFQMKAGLTKIFETNVDSTYTDTHQSHSQANLTNITYSAYFKGGDIRHHVQNLANISSTDASRRISQWIESLTIQPLMLKTNMQLVPLSYYAEKINKNAAQNIELASKELFQASLNYVPPPPPPPPPPRPKVQPPQPENSGDCLKAGTLIMSSDGHQLPIEMIRSGDMILDIKLKPCKVIGVIYMLLDCKKFHGFSKTNCFFTGGHIFARDKSNEFFVVSKEAILKDNPFINELNVVEIKPNQSIKVMKFKNDSGKKHIVVCENVTIYKDETKYDSTTPVYFLIVESETGTYIANGYVCRHELPTFERWPNTLACFQEIFASNIVKQNSIGRKLTPSTLRRIEKIVDHVAEQLEREFSSKCETFFNDITNTGHENISTKYTIPDLSSYLTILTEMIENNYWSTFGMLIYGRCGNLIRELLDNQKQQTISISQIADFIIKSIENFSENN
ncbi:unnamed protein product [Rotaria magnacalcarata]